MNKTKESPVGCPSGITNSRTKRYSRNNNNNKFKNLKGSSKLSKERAIYYRETLLEEGRVHGGAALISQIIKQEAALNEGENNKSLSKDKEGFKGWDLFDTKEFVYNNPKVSGPEGRVHGGNLLALISGNGGIEGLRN